MAALKKSKDKKKSKKLNYFDAFIRQIELADKEADFLLDIVNNFSTAEAIAEELPKIHELENDADQICHEVYAAILPDFVTPIDREDIVRMTDELDDLVDRIEEVVQCFYMYDIHFMYPDAVKMANLIKTAVGKLHQAMLEFEHAKKSKVFNDLLIEAETAEDEADIVYMEVMHKLFTVERDHPTRIMVWSNVFGVMEDTVDQCEEIAGIMRSILLKHG